jgi:Double zinc ribbon/Adenylate and Guanylate cyclase catalytic domain
MRCPKCKTENPEGKKFCVECGVRLSLNCAACGAPLAAGEKFCGECGAAIGPTPAPASTKKSADSPIRVAETSTPEYLEGERKIVTALFADIKGSTELEQDLDPEEARRIVDPALKLMIAAVNRYNGYVVQSTGDGIFAIRNALCMQRCGCRKTSVATRRHSASAETRRSRFGSA